MMAVEDELEQVQLAHSEIEKMTSSWAVHGLYVGPVIGPSREYYGILSEGKNMGKVGTAQIGRASCRERVSSPV